MIIVIRKTIHKTIIMNIMNSDTDNNNDNNNNHDNKDSHNNN